jgi:hypothetical protein
MGEAFQQSFPVEHDVPPAMRALIARLAQLESKAESAVVPGCGVHGGKSQRLRQARLA